MNASPATRRVVVGIDGSRGAARAAAWAARLAAHRDAQLQLLHAIHLTGAVSLITRLPFDEYRQIRMKEAEALLDEVRADLLGRYPALSISTEIFTSDAAEALVASTGPSVLTVVGTRGRGGFPGLRLGSVGLRLCAHCRGPVVFVPGDTSAEDGVEVVGEGASADAAAGPVRGEVVLGVAPGESPEVIDFAFDLAEELGAPLRGVHAWQPIPPYNGYYYIEPSILATAAEELLGAALAPAERDHPAIRTTTDAVCATPAAALVEAGRDAQLLVLGAHRRRMPLSIGIGPVLHAVMTHTPCPVAVVPLPTREHRR